MYYTYKIQRIQYKIAALTYKIRMTGQPGYLQTAVRDYTPTRELRSSDESPGSNLD